MNIFTDVPINRFKGFKRIEPIALDSSAVKELQKCPRAYFFRYVLGYTSAGEKLWFAWGTAVHKFYEEAEESLKRTNNIELSIAFGISAAIQSWGSTKDAPANDKKWGHMTKARLSSVLTYAAKEWRKEKESGIIKVTQSEFPFVIATQFNNWISGKIDQIVNWNGRLWIRDFKTTSKKWLYYRRDIQPSDQFARYTYAVKKLTGQNITGAIVDVIITQNDDKPPQFERESVTYTHQELEEWEKSQQYWDKVRTIYREDDHYPMCERSCNWCDYRDVCTSRGEQQQIYMLKSKFKFEPWDNAAK